jgi:hypothetical protein
MCLASPSGRDFQGFTMRQFCKVGHASKLVNQVSVFRRRVVPEEKQSVKRVPSEADAGINLQFIRLLKESHDAARSARKSKTKNFNMRMTPSKKRELDEASESSGFDRVEIIEAALDFVWSHVCAAEKCWERFVHDPHKARPSSPELRRYEYTVRLRVMEAVVLEQERILLPFSISTGNATLASKMASLVSGAKEALEKAKKSLEIINALEVLLEASLRKEALDGSIHALDLELEILRSREKELSDEIHAREVSESQE